MFTDTEVAIIMANRRNVDGLVRDANAVIDGKDRHIAALEALLVREQRKNGDLVRERGRARNAILAARLARKH